VQAPGKNVRVRPAGVQQVVESTLADGHFRISDHYEGIKEVPVKMPMREKDRKLRRKQRRQNKIRKLKGDLEEAKSLEERERIIEKIRKIHPWIDLE
jgi:hypothetical protein